MLPVQIYLLLILVLLLNGTDVQYLFRTEGLSGQMDSDYEGYILNFSTLIEMSVSHILGNMYLY